MSTALTFKKQPLAQPWANPTWVAQFAGRNIGVIERWTFEAPTACTEYRFLPLKGPIRGAFGTLTEVREDITDSILDHLGVNF